MTAIDLQAVMDECASRMGIWGDYDTALFVRAYGWPNPIVSPPAFVVGFPPLVNFDATMARGVDRVMDLPAWAVMGKPDERQSRDRVIERVLEVKARLEAAGFTDPAWATAWVKTVQFTTVANEDGTEYIAAQFTIDIAT